MILEGEEEQANGMPGLEGLWGMEPNFPPLVEIPADADDETMVELAIALSLQEQVRFCKTPVAAYPWLSIHFFIHLM